MLKDILRAEFAELVSIEKTIRYGDEPDNPTLMRMYLKKGKDLAHSLNDLPLQRGIYVGLASTLLDAICDSCVPRHWRCFCLDNIYIPMHAIEKLAFSEQHKAHVRHLWHEINVSSRYFL